MPNLPTAQEFIQRAVEIAKNPTVLESKLRILKKYDLLGPILKPDRLGDVAMFHAGRSGSTVLGRLLDQHPQIYWGSEIYHPRLRDARPQLLTGGTIAIDPRTLLKESSRWVGRRYFGFEVKFIHLKQTGIAPSDYYEILREFGVERYIILERKNYLRMLVSKLIGRDHGRMFVKTSEQTSLLQVGIPIHDLIPHLGQPPQTLVEFMANHQNQFAEARALLRDATVLELSAGEHILPDPQIGYRRVCEFLGVEPVPVQVLTRRGNPYPLREIISNFAEVEQALLNTPFEWMLYDND